MTKTTKTLVANIVILLIAFMILPFMLKWYQNNYIDVNLVQKIIFILMLCDFAILIYINNKNRIQIKNFKWIWVAFEILGILGVIYSGFVLYLIFSLQNIGF